MIILSAIPIALAVNIMRITVTALLAPHGRARSGRTVFHDLDGWFMMPMALGLLYVEFQILSHLVIDDTAAGPLQIGGAGGTLGGY